MFKPSGSLSATSSPLIKVSPNVEIAIQKEQSDIEKLAKEPYINETFSNRTTRNPITNFNAIASLYRFAQSTPITVTYFTKNTGPVNLKTADTEFSSSIGITQNFLKIVNFEMKLDGALSYSYDDDNNVTVVQGSSFMYPRFDVCIGDIFLYQIDTGTLGLFKITSKTPLSMHKDSLNKCDFELILYPTTQDLTELNLYVDRTSYFYKDTFLNGNVGLIYDEDYQLLQVVAAKRLQLLEYYMNTFYDEDAKSFFRPDGIYDPYLVDFLQHFINFYLLDRYPAQLFSNSNNKRTNLFYFILNFDKCMRNQLVGTYSVFTRNFSYRDTDINTLIGKKCLDIVKNPNEIKQDPITTISSQPVVLSDDTYVFTNFYNPIKDNYNQLERLLDKYVTERSINPVELTTAIDNFLNLDPMNQFYYIPIYIYLLSIVESMVLK